jgi:KDO2-lipid IV(A) lauroyltransferase
VLRLAALWFLVHVLGRLPARVLDAAAAGGGTLAWYASPRLRATTRDHMRRVLGDAASTRDRDRAARGCVRSAARYYTDFARYYHLPPERVFDAVDEIVGLDRLFEAIDRGCGIIFTSSHLGNPEFVLQAIGSFGFRTLVFTEPLEPPRLLAFVNHVRGRRGVEFVAADLRGVREALAVLRAGGAVAAVSDRDVLGTARPYPFFGAPAPMPAGAVELARRTHATIVNGWVLRTRPGRYRVYLEQVPLPPKTGDREADLESGMRTLIARLEAGIREAPGQWFPLEPIWPRDPGAPTGG